MTLDTTTAEDQHTSPSATSRLAVAVCTRDNRDTIERCLRSVASVADELLVVDSGSTDGTPDVARSLGARVVHHDWEGMVGQRLFAASLVGHCRWILFLDSDEAVDEVMAASIDRVVRDESSPVAGHEMRRMTWFLGDWLRHTFQPEWRLRLVRTGRFTITGLGPRGEGGHDRISVDGPVGRLDGICRHDTWRDLSHMFQRQIFFAERAARHADRGGRVRDLLVRPPAAVFKQLVLRQGFRDGARGLIACFGVGVGVSMKHLFIMRARRLGDAAAAVAPDGADPDPGARG